MSQGTPASPGGRLAGDHAHLVHLATRRRLHRVEAEERPARDEDPPAAIGREVHAVEMIEERPHAHADEGAARFEGGAGDAREGGRGCAFHDDIGEFRQFSGRAHGRRGAEIRAAFARAVEVPRRHRGEIDSGEHACIERSRNLETDGAEPGDGYPDGPRVPHVRMGRRGHVASRVTPHRQCGLES